MLGFFLPEHGCFFMFHTQIDWLIQFQQIGFCYSLAHLGQAQHTAIAFSNLLCIVMYIGRGLSTFLGCGVALVGKSPVQRIFTPFAEHLLLIFFAFFACTLTPQKQCKSNYEGHPNAQGGKIWYVWHNSGRPPYKRLPAWSTKIG